MSLEKAESYLKEAGFLDHVIELKESTATVALAAEALGVEPGMIAKTMSFLQKVLRKWITGNIKIRFT